MPIIKPGDLDDDRVKALLTRHLGSMHANSPPGHVFALDWSGLQKPEISFYALWEGEDLLGFGALKELEPLAGEIKSMRTADAHLRKGVATAILDHIIAEARQRGYSRLSLETGSGPAFEPALKLYRKYGFVDGEPFGGYEKSPSISSSILTCATLPALEAALLRDVGVHPEQVLGLHSFHLPQPSVVLSKRRTDFFRPVVRRQVIDVAVPSRCGSILPHNDLTQVM